MGDRFTATVKEGRLVFNDPKRFREVMCRRVGNRVVVIIEDEFATRTLEQNAYYWGVVLHDIASHTGHTEKELHKFFKEKFGVSSTALQDQKHFSVYVERVIAFSAQELGCPVRESDHVDPVGTAERVFNLDTE